MPTTYISCCCCIIDLRKSSRKIKKNQVISEKEIKILLIKIMIIIILLNTYDYLINDPFPPTTQSCLHDKLVMNTFDQYYELPLLF
jgi:hypothetical protein